MEGSTSEGTSFYKDVSGGGHELCLLVPTNFCGQCLIGDRMPKQSSSLSFPKDMTGEETDPDELEFDETDSSSFFGARLCKIWRYSS